MEKHIFQPAKLIFSKIKSYIKKLHSMYVHIFIYIIIKVWRDLKSNTSKKASKIRNEKNRTGNFPVTSEPLDSLEQRIIGCIGLEYIQGTSDCPDSVPEDEVFLLILH